jgi:hypothetical protein
MVQEKGNVVNQRIILDSLPLGCELRKVRAVARYGVSMLMTIQGRPIETQMIMQILLRFVGSLMKAPDRNGGHGNLDGIKPLQPKARIFVEGIKPFDGYLFGISFGFQYILQ